MRHGKKVNHLGRKAAHRHALLSNMASSLILNKRITTTVAKAKALRKYVEPLLTKAKDDTTHSRRTVFSYLQNKESVKTLFGEVASKISDRPGGYTRIIKLGDVRVGDNAEMCLIELVDYNTLYTKDGAVKKAKTRRSRRGGKKGAEGTEAEVATETAEAAEPKAEKKAKAPAKKAPAKKAASKKSKE
jgi:large subunit ribosomal protein L17